MFALNKIICIFFLFLLFSINYDDLIYIENKYYIGKIIKGFDYNFKLLLQLIETCVLNYFYLFKICYITSVNIILISVNNYFIVFNNLFMFTLEFIRSNIINSYLYSLCILEIISIQPINYMIFIYFMTKLYINALNN